MSTQETKLKAIADAIREKDGTTAPIIANDFPARIRAIQTGGGLPDNLRTISVTAEPPDKAAVSGGGMATDGMEVTVTAEGSDGSYLFDGWKENNEVVGIDEKYSFVVSSDRFLTAAFIKAQYIAGVDWWESKMPANRNWTGVCYGESVFVAVAYNTDRGAYSTDGITWYEIILPQVAKWNDVCYGNGLFVATSNDGKSAYSTDGLRWQSGVVASGVYLGGVAYGKGVYMSACNNVSGNATKVAGYSEDGINWVAASLPTAEFWQGVTFGSDSFFATPANSKYAAYSYGANQWIRVELPYSLGWRKAAYGNGFFLTVDRNGSESKCAKSYGAVNYWVSRSLAGMYYCICFGGGKFVALGSTSKAIVSHTTDGDSWTTIEDATPKISYNDIAYGNGKFVAVPANNDTMIYSSARGPGK